MLIGAHIYPYGPIADQIPCCLINLILKHHTSELHLHHGFLDSQSVPGFVIGSWIRDRFLDSQWIPGFVPEFTMGSWFPHRFLDSGWVPGFTMGSRFLDSDRFLDSRCVPEFMMGSWIHDWFLDARWVPGFMMGSWFHD